jgi:Uma2 family endonuclease
VPDLAGWRRARMPRLPDEAWFALAPDWVCEVLSPTTARLDRGEKLPIYATVNVAHIWLVDPVLRTLEAFENSSDKWLLLAVFKDDQAVSIPPFDAISFSLGALMGRLVLLCHKSCLAFMRPQHGQRGTLAASQTLSW